MVERGRLQDNDARAQDQQDCVRNRDLTGRRDGRGEPVSGSLRARPADRFRREAAAGYLPRPVLSCSSSIFLEASALVSSSSTSTPASSASVCR